MTMAAMARRALAEGKFMTESVVIVCMFAVLFALFVVIDAWPRKRGRPPQGRPVSSFQRTLHAHEKAPL